MGVDGNQLDSVGVRESSLWASFWELDGVSGHLWDSLCVIGSMWEFVGLSETQ